MSISTIDIFITIRHLTYKESVLSYIIIINKWIPKPTRRIDSLNSFRFPTTRLNTHRAFKKSHCFLKAVFVFLKQAKISMVTREKCTSSENFTISFLSQGLVPTYKERKSIGFRTGFRPENWCTRSETGTFNLKIKMNVLKNPTKPIFIN